MLSFRIFNIKVSVQPWFWITLGLIGGGLRATDSWSMLLVLMFIVAGFISILVHELGHALTIRKYGLPTEIFLVAFGGFATHPQGRLGRKESFLVTAAGPVVQFALGIIAYLLLIILPVPPESLIRWMLIYLSWISVVWALLNCLPIHPMDGGQMLGAVLGPKNQRKTYLVGAITALVVGLVGFFLMKALILALFMGYFAYQNWQKYQQS